MSQNFRNAVAKSSNRRKTTVKHGSIESRSGQSFYIDRWVFYKNDEILNEEEIVMVMSITKDPIISIPMPEVRRKVKLDGKFFLTKNSAQGVDLYCPYYYFFFEDGTEKTVRGWKSYLYNAKISKLDPTFRYVHAAEPREIVVDKIKKQEVLNLYAEKFKFERKVSDIQEKIAELDPDNEALEEYEAVMDKMKGSDMFSNLKGVL